MQSRFVDDPKAAVRDADELVTRLMQTRGYPMSDFEQRTADISVDHPRVVDNYRAAHEIAIRHQSGQATTEDLRNAIIYYRSLFDELLKQTGTNQRGGIMAEPLRKDNQLTTADLAGRKEEHHWIQVRFGKSTSLIAQARAQ